MAASFVAPHAALAQAQTAQAPAIVDEIVVTGTRVVRDGYEAPTPLTVLNVDEIEAVAPANLAEFVNQIPSVVESTTPAGGLFALSSGQAGISSVNLRGIGNNRTLVLLDGQRSVASILNGTVDVNNFPQGLVQRVEVVTGGASAAYGSDAVSGVVNFILDREYTGVKGEVSGGLTTYGDDPSWKTTLTGGFPFAGGKGHVLLSGEASMRYGIFNVPRDWNNNGCYQINNPNYTATNGLPERLVTCGAGLSNATPGGIIASTALRGIAFGPGGAPYNFNYGLTLDPWMIGGEWRSVQANSGQALQPSEERQVVFTRVSYELAEAVEVFGMFSWNFTDSEGLPGIQFNQGNVLIRADNAFLPADIRARAAALGISQFNLGTMNEDLPDRRTDNERFVTRYVFGADGAFDAGGTEWTWDAYYQYGHSRASENLLDITNNAALAAAQDAVFHPTTGFIVCRSSIANPGNGCIPINRMGLNVNSAAAIKSIIGNPQRNQKFVQQVGAINLAGSPFEIWAGPVSLALGAEHRTEEVSGRVETIYQSGWFVGNFLPNFGKYNVTEGYLETVVPLMTGLELNAAARATDYSTSGFVTTWKGGLTYAPVPDIRFRLTRSRDIRAPNLQELFAAGTSNTNNVIDPFRGNQSTQYRGFNTGNPNLLPEKADTLGLGVVVQPSFLSGLSFAVDYYDIKIKDAIGTVGAQVIVDRCFEGNQQFCAAITRGLDPSGANVIERISISPFNLVQSIHRGIDFEVTYQMSLSDIVADWEGDLRFRAFATRYLKDYRNNGIDPPTEEVGQSPRKLHYRGSITYASDPITVTLSGRGFTSGVYDNSFVECQTGCPRSTVTNRTINTNHVPPAFYLDLSLQYGFDIGELQNEVFLNIRNIRNTDPGLYAQGPGGSAYGLPQTDTGLYDYLGRTFRAGIRFRM
ncbi:MAG: TonB-dependent receptor plug domain-containing protein [Rhodospirillaceae bacterium]